MAAVLVLAGCDLSTTGSGASSTVPVTTTATAAVTTAAPTPALLTATGPVPTAVVNDLQTGSAHHNLAVDGENFHLKIDYFTTSNPSTWNAFTDKNVHLLAYLNPEAASTPPEVLIDNFQAQYRLRAANPALDALILAGTQDQPVGSNPGFLITPVISYGTVFTTEGVTPELLARWQSVAGKQPLSEAAMTKAGAFGIDITFTYRLLVRDKGDTNWRHRTTTDHLAIHARAAVGATA